MTDEKKYNMSSDLSKFLKKKMTAREFARNAVAYLDSPEWQRKKAAMAAEDLKAWRAGRERLMELIAKAERDGYKVEYERCPLREGHDSIVVRVEGGGTGFPSFFCPEMVEMNFTDIMKRAEERRQARLAEEKG